MTEENSDIIPGSVNSQSQTQNNTSSLGPTEKKSKSTGPRTKVGKRISSGNARRHGAFSKEIIREHLNPSDRRKYTEFLNGLIDALKPEGQAEMFQIELMASYKHKHLCVLRLARALRGDATRESMEDLFIRGTDSEITEQWRIDLPPLEQLEKFHRAEHHCLHNYNRAFAELERLQRMRLGQKVLPRFTFDVNN